METEELYTLFLQHPSVKIDTRKINKGDIFFALKGPNFNGNHFAKQALEAGAACVVVDEELNFSDSRLVRTNDVLTTLQQLAGHHRQKFKIPFIAITGSNGKTTTKELVHQVLSSSYKTYTTQGNLNNHIGIPLTLLSIREDAEMAVIEMGANHQKEIEAYCSYTRPTHGLITNIGKAHLEGFGGIEGVKKGKGELFVYLRETGGTAFVNSDDPSIVQLSDGINKIVYGKKEGTVQGETVKSSTFLEVKINTDAEIGLVQTQLVGDYNLPNVLAAVTIAKYFKVAPARIKKALQDYIPSNSRSQLIKRDSNTFILDAYNANPASMKAAIENFAKMEGRDKILMLGSMMELGPESEDEHAGIIELIKKYKWKNVVLVGNNFKNTPGFLHFDNSVEAGKWLQQQHLANSQLLIKGSRSMQMEKVLDL
jgi:UDP-N-acetylmuramoyl-tripeptide--D-alanyl-D-alanine ligase